MLICSINEQGPYRLFQRNLIFVQESKLIMDQWNLSLRLGQISLESLHKFQALTELRQGLGALSQPKPSQINERRTLWDV